mmetsp:Transcript_17461/g.24289  ORF Transcript_17461/g.24289 Transcript_17461/m.24289 type:complete len:110 (+) Transcript_17461:373-702(+)
MVFQQEQQKKKERARERASAKRERERRRKREEKREKTTFLKGGFLKDLFPKGLKRDQGETDIEREKRKKTKQEIAAVLPLSFLVFLFWVFFLSPFRSLVWDSFNFVWLV